MSEWQPMETAPDGVRILAFCPRERYDRAVTIAAVYRRNPRVGDGRMVTRYPMGAEVYATHWQPLPKPPEI